MLLALTLGCTESMDYRFGVVSDAGEAVESGLEIPTEAAPGEAPTDEASEDEAGQPGLEVPAFEVSFQARHHRSNWGDQGTCTMRLAIHEADTRAALAGEGPLAEIDERIGVATWSELDGDSGWAEGEHLDGPESIWLHGDDQSFELLATEREGNLVYEREGCEDYPHGQAVDLDVPAGGGLPAFRVEGAIRFAHPVTLLTPGPLSGGTYVHDVAEDLVIDWEHGGELPDEQIVYLYSRHVDDAAPSEVLSWRADELDGLVLATEDLALLPADQGELEHHSTLELSTWTDSAPFLTPGGESGRIRTNSAMGGPVWLVTD